MFKESTTPLLKPNQVEDFRATEEQISSMLAAPPHVSNAIENRGELQRQLKALRKQLETQSPRAYEPDVKDLAVTREEHLRDKILEGMPTQAEMRKSPVGAVDKHRAWESRIKPLLAEWKNIRKRLHADGSLGSLRDAADISNFERYRPVGGSQEMNMDNALIPPKTIQLPDPGSDPAVVMSADDSETLKELDPELHSQMALLDSENRQKVIDFIRNIDAPKKPNEIAVLRAEAKSLGINSFGKGKDALREEIAARKAA